MSCCPDCGKEISRGAMRCRQCSMRNTQRNSIKAPGKPGAERQRDYRARHPERNKQNLFRSRQKKRDLVSAYKAERGCEDCGITDPRVLDLHHRDGTEKEAAVSQLLSRSAWSEVQAEMEKCSVLCANCHRIAHYTERRDALTSEPLPLFSGLEQTQ